MNAADDDPPHSLRHAEPPQRGRIIKVGRHLAGDLGEVPDELVDEERVAAGLALDRLDQRRIYHPVSPAGEQLADGLGAEPADLDRAERFVARQLGER